MIGYTRVGPVIRVGSLRRLSTLTYPSSFQSPGSVPALSQPFATQSQMEHQRKRQRRPAKKTPSSGAGFSTQENRAAQFSAAQTIPTQAGQAVGSPSGSATPSERPDAVPYATLSGRLDHRLLKALELLNFRYMTPVQEMVLAQLPDFRSDCLVRAKTGTGKTVAFFLPALHSMLNSPAPRRGQVSILVISPTRELALQIAKECDQLTSQIQPQVECHTAFGGTARESNLKKFMQGSPSILVATPGRLYDYLSEPATAKKFADVKTVILDEADTMLEQGFLVSINRILKLLPQKDVAGWQGMCFSATMPEKIKDVINIVLFPGYTSLSTIDVNEQPTIDKVPQFHVPMPSLADMFTHLASIIDFESRNNSKIIVFGITANIVAILAKLFAAVLTNLKVYELHSRLTQNVRTRTTAAFKAADKGILFASDVVGRGMDFPNVDLVIQVGLPSSAEQYVHRVGRTGRAENSGRAVILLTHAESFFLRKNPKLPIQPHEHTAEILANTAQTSELIEQIMYSIDEQTKQRAYSSLLGFFAGSGLMKPLGLDKAGLVQVGNDFAKRGMHCPEPPPMEKKTIGKMGLKGVPGINYAPAAAVQDQARGGGRGGDRKMNGGSVRDRSVGGGRGGQSGRSGGDTPREPRKPFRGRGAGGVEGAGRDASANRQTKRDNPYF